MMARAIAGQVVFITGGARGIGLKTAEQFADAGACVVIADRDEEALSLAQKNLSGDVHARPLDVTDADAFAAVIKSVEAEVGSIDVLVNNAGVMTLGAFVDQPAEHDRKQVDVNIHGVLNGMRAVLGGMRARGRGHVLNVASMAGKLPVPHAAVYSATKHAIVGLTEAVRFELADSGVRLSYVMPIPVQTELIAGIRPMRWPPPVTPEQVAAAIVDAVRHGRIDVYVPATQRWVAQMAAVTPRAALERLARFLGADRIFAEADHPAREDYERRATGRDA